MEKLEAIYLSNGKIIDIALKQNTLNALLIDKESKVILSLTQKNATKSDYFKTRKKYEERANGAN